jgi:hypothetical protein
MPEFLVRHVSTCVHSVKLDPLTIQTAAEGEGGIVFWRMEADTALRSVFVGLASPPWK